MTNKGLLGKYRIVERYNPCCGTWYVIQKKSFFKWKDLNLYFDDIDQAVSYLDDINDADNDYTCQRVLYKKGEHRYGVVKDEMIKVRYF